jgi:hypothetical protein
MDSTYAVESTPRSAVRIARAVVRHRAGRAVVGVGVDLDDEAGVRPGEVAHPALDDDVAGRARDAVLVTEVDDEVLECAPGLHRGVRVARQHRFEGRDPRRAAVAFDQSPHLAEVDEPHALGPIHDSF